MGRVYFYKHPNSLNFLLKGSYKLFLITHREFRQESLHTASHSNCFLKKENFIQNTKKPDTVIKVLPKGILSTCSPRRY